MHSVRAGQIRRGHRHWHGEQCTSELHCRSSSSASATSRSARSLADTLTPRRPELVDAEDQVGAERREGCGTIGVAQGSVGPKWSSARHGCGASSASSVQPRLCETARFCAVRQRAAPPRRDHPRCAEPTRASVSVEGAIPTFDTPSVLQICPRSLTSRLCTSRSRSFFSIC